MVECYSRNIKDVAQEVYFYALDENFMTENSP